MAIQREIVFKGDDSQYASIVDRVGRTTADAFDNAGDSIDRANERLSDFTESVEAELEKVRESGRNIFEGMLQSSEKYSSSVKDRLAYLQRELTLQERLVAEEREKERLAASIERDVNRRKYTDMGFSDETARRMSDDDYDERMAELRSKEQVRQLEMQSTRNAFNSYRNDRKNEEDDEEDDDKKRRRRGGSSWMGNAFSAAAGAAGFGAILSIAGFIGKMIQEGEDLSRATTQFRGLSNGGFGSVGGMYDLKTADALRYGVNVARTRGSMEGIRGAAFDQYSFEKAYSLDAGSLNNMNTALRLDAGGRSSSQIALEMLNFFKQSKVFGVDKGDFSRMSELLEINNELNTQQTDQLARIDPSSSTNIMRLMGAMGVDSSKITQYTEGLNRGITDPSSDFSQAIVYRALRRANPEMSLFELQERQEQGIYGKGNLSAVMRELSGSASGEMLMKFVSEAFGLKNFQARTLVDAYNKDSSLFDTEEGLEYARSVSQTDVRNRASGNTTVLQGLLAQFNDTMGGWGAQALNKVGEYVNAFQSEGFEGLFTKLSKDITNAITTGWSKIQEGFPSWLGGGVKAKPQGIAEETYQQTMDSLNNESSAIKRFGQGMGLDWLGAKDREVAQRRAADAVKASGATGFARSMQFDGGTGVLTGGENDVYNYSFRNTRGNELGRYKLKMTDAEKAQFAGESQADLAAALGRIFEIERKNPAHNKPFQDPARNTDFGEVNATTLRQILTEIKRQNQGRDSSTRNRVSTGN